MMEDTGRNINDSFIDIKGLTKWYPAKGKNPEGGKSYIKALDDVNVTLKKGEILGVIGESGCGKSTFGKVFTRIEEPTKGEVIIDGINTRELVKKDSKEFRKLVQMIFQNPFDTFTPKDRILDILKRPVKLHNLMKDDSKIEELLKDKLEKSGLTPAEEILKRYPHELSGGQLQRISIVRSMLLEPKVIVADEPVSMLDLSVRAEIINALLEVNRKENTSIIFISHDISLTKYISDMVAVMYLGKIVEYGKAEEVMEDPKHPYTRVLLSNAGTLDVNSRKDHIKITGEPPTPLNPGPGCYFCDRCFKSQKECFEKQPEIRFYSKTHYALCDK